MNLLKRIKQFFQKDDLLRLTFISDTHCDESADLGSGDILFHSGDLSWRGTSKEIKRQLDWLSKQEFKHKVIICGNHEVNVELGRTPMKRYCEERGITWLQDSSIELLGLKIHGSPRTVEFCGWAYMHEDEDLKHFWDKIPEDTDVLLTHGPPKGILDKTRRTEYHVGSETLRDRVNELNLKVHSFGHIHEAHGTLKQNGTLYINAAIMTRDYMPYNPPTKVIYTCGTMILEEE